MENRKIKEIQENLKKRKEVRNAVATCYVKEALSRNNAGEKWAYLGEIAGLIPHTEWDKVKNYNEAELSEWVKKNQQNITHDTQEKSITDLEKIEDEINEKIAISLNGLSKEKEPVKLKFDENGKKYEVIGKIETVIMNAVRMIEDGEPQANDYLLFYLTGIKSVPGNKS